MKWLSAFLKSPSSYRRDPAGFLLNQVGHVALVGALPTVLGVPFGITLFLFLIWEVWQWMYYRAEAWDGFEDWAFVAAGAVAVSAPVVLIPVVAFLASGAIRRFDELPKKRR